MAGELYHPITSYQTRLLCLDGDDGSPGSQISCSISTADLLHPNIEGLLVRSNATATESVIEYDALSYAWGSGGKVSKIRCNGLQVPVTENLSEALRALRHSTHDGRFLWVDALCINQDDSSEKNEQVWNMLAIYQKARKVIAWLGTAEQKDMECLLLVTSARCLSFSSDHNDPVLDFWGTVKGLTYLYTRPWFKRLWVQQEIFAARELEFQCGNHCFEWSAPLYDPLCLLRSERPKDWIAYGQMRKDGKKIRSKGTYETPDEVADQIDAQSDAISNLLTIVKQNLTCFKEFAEWTTYEPPDFVHTLLDTALLDATNPRDYIYSILGMTKYPAKPMRIQDWLLARRTEKFIPIDYSADLTSIVSAVTWFLLMNLGLKLLEYLKVFSANDSGTCGQSLPSWAIDWQTSARFFSGAHPSVPFGELDKDSHVQFRKDNQDCDAIIPCNKLILRGTPDSRFYIKKNSVWEKRRLRSDTLAWRLECDVQPTDLLVRIHAFPDALGQKCGDLWLLRPVGKDEYKIIAWLSWGSYLNILPSPPSPPATPSQIEVTSSGRPLNQCHRLRVKPETKTYKPKDYWHYECDENYGPTKEDLDSANARAFTIV